MSPTLDRDGRLFDGLHGSGDGVDNGGSFWHGFSSGKLERMLRGNGLVKGEERLIVRE